MKKIFLVLAVAALAASPLYSQTTAEEYHNRYNSLSAKVGPAGLGIETLLDKWENDFPEDTEMMNARITYYLLKAQSYQVIQKDQSKYLGNQPLMTLKDTLGKSHNYFQDVIYDDEYFSAANKMMDKAINLNPLDLQLRTDKLAMLASYEKEEPDMFTQNLLSLIDFNFSSHPVWTVGGTKASEDAFPDMVQEECYTLFTISSPTSMASFKTVSEKMLAYMPKSTNFLSNVGSYYLSFAKDPKTAIKYYSKVLKLDPGNYAAAKNCVIAARRLKDKKLEKKYLQILVPILPDGIEKKGFQTQLDALK